MNTRNNDLGDKSFLYTMNVLSCGRPNLSATARRYDSYCMPLSGVKKMQFTPEFDTITFTDDNRTNSDRYTIQKHCLYGRDPAYLRFSTESEY